MKKFLSGFLSLAFAVSAMSFAPAAMADGSKSVTINFEEFTDGTAFTDTVYGAGVLKVISSSSENKTEVVQDEKMGSKALKITKAVGGGRVNVRYTFNDAISSGLYDMYVDARVEHAEGYVDKFGTLNLEDSYGSTSANVALNTYGVRVGNDVGVFGGLNDGSKYTFHYAIDADNRAINWEIIKDGSVVKTFNNMDNWSVNAGGIKSVNFSIVDPNSESGFTYGWDYNKSIGEQAPTVMYIDNIIVAGSELKVNSSYYSGANGCIKLAFNTEPSDDFASSIEVCDQSGNKLTDCTMAKDASDPSVINIGRTGGFDTGTYTVSIKNLDAKNSGYAALASYSAMVKVKGANILEVIDFEDVEAGTALSETAYTMGSLKVENGASTNKAEVVTDSKMGSKALKITKGVESGNINVRYVFNDEISSGMYDLYMDLRVPHAEAYVDKFGTLNAEDGAGSTIVNSALNYEGIKIRNNRDFYDITDGEKYTYHYIIDADSKTINWEIIKDGEVLKKMDGVDDNFANRNIKSMNFRITDPGSGSLEYTWNYDPTKGVQAPTVVFVDNITIEKHGIQATDAQMDGKNITVTFDAEPADDFASSIEVYGGNEALDFDAAKDGKTVVITLKDDIKYDTEYTINIKQGMKAKNSAVYKSVRDYTWNFMSEQDPTFVIDANAYSANGAPVSDITEFAGTTVTVKANIAKRLTDYVFIAALKDGEGRLKDVAIVNSNDVENYEAALTLDIPENVDENYVIEGFLFDKNQAPITAEKLSIVKKKLSFNAIYVDAAAQQGGSGTKEAPFKTVAQAISAASAVSGKKEIVIKSGVYSADNISLTYNNNNTTIRAYGNDDVTLRGGTTLGLSDFETATDSRIKSEVSGQVKKINIKNLGIQEPRILMSGISAAMVSGAGYSGVYGTTSTASANGEMLRIARYPNEGYMTIAAVENAGSLANKTPMVFSTNDSEAKKWNSVTGAYAHGYWYYDWADQTVQLDKIANGKITTVHPSGYGVRAGQRFYVYNLLEELDVPGEWYYDKTTGDFFVIPPENCSEITLSFNNAIMFNMNNTDNFAFCGITLEGAARNVIYAYNCDNLTMKNCTIRNTGDTAVYIDGGESAMIDGCRVYNVGGTGVRLNGGSTTTLVPGNHTIKNCEVHDTGMAVKTYMPNISCEGAGIKILNNKLYNSNHSAIIFNGNDHVISGNEIYNVLTETADAGAIYAGRSSIKRGTLISGNYIHDIAATAVNTDPIAIYLDDGMCGTDISGNRFENIGGTGIFISGGRDNQVLNNTFSKITNDAVRMTSTGTASWSGYANDDEYAADHGLKKGLHQSEPYRKYVNLYNILNDEPRKMKYNTIRGNEFDSCGKKVSIKSYKGSALENYLELLDIRKNNTIED